MTELHIADELALPVDAVTQAIAILARRGAGKTHTASVLVEEVIKAGQPVVVLDPTGAWWGLRSSADGAHEGLPVVILGGEHGDVPLEAAAGKVIADLVVDHPGAFVLDLSGFESNASQDRFVTDFLERLYRAKATRKDPLLVVVDEADSFAPQRAMPGQQRMLGAMEAIVRRGRIRGLGVVLISQRAAVLNKNVLTQTEVLVAMQTTSPQDRAAIDAWIEGNGTKEERALVLESLASLERGEAWVWSPGWLRILQRVRIRRRETFDSSKTPETGQRSIEPRAFAPVDLEALGDRIRSTIEQAKANDPEQLRRRIRELERAAAAGPDESAGDVEELYRQLGEASEQLAASQAEVLAAENRRDRLDDGLRGFADRLEVIVAGMRELVESRPEPAATRIPTHTPRQTPAPIVQRPPAPKPAVDATDGEVQLDAGARRMLECLASLHPSPLTRQQLGTLANVPHTGSTFRTYLSQLRRAALIEEPDKAIVRLSGSGTERMASSLGTGAPSVAELVAMWGRKVDAGARRMLDILVAIHPSGISRESLGEQTGIPHGGSTFRTYLSQLRRNQLLEETGGDVHAGPALFIGEAR